MRALQIEKAIGPEGLRLADVPAPEAGGNVLIDVHAAGVTYPDLLLSRGEYQDKPDPPFTPGTEVAGVVAAAPDGSGFKPGDEVVAATLMGGFAEQVAVPAALVAPLPRALDFAAGAALVCNYHTAHFALHRRARLLPGETVAVLGPGLHRDPRAIIDAAMILIAVCLPSLPPAPAPAPCHLRPTTSITEFLQPSS